MTSASKRHRTRGHQVAVGLLTLYLTACVVVSGCMVWSPWLHLVLEHGSLDPRHAHVHLPLGESPKSTDLFADFPNSPSSRVGSHSHPHSHSHDEESSGESEPKPLPPVPGHSHQGLPELLVYGLLELPNPQVLPEVCPPEYPGSLTESGVRIAPNRVFDSTQSARPPPPAFAGT